MKPVVPVRVRHFRRRKVCGASRATSTTSKPGTTSRPSSPKARRGSPRRAAPRAPAPRSSRWWARFTTAAWSRCRWARRSRPSSTTSAEAGRTAAPSRRCRPAGRPAAAFRSEMFDTPGRLRKPGAAGLHHGLGRHGGDGRRQLHGRRRPLLRRVHQLGVVRQVHSVPRRAEQVPAHPESRYRWRRPHGSPGAAGRTEPLHPRLLAVRAGADRAQSGAHHDAALPPGVRRPHRLPSLRRRRLHRAGAVAVREQLPAAHEHPALPRSSTRKDRSRKPSSRSSWTTRCRARPGVSASIPATTAAAGRRSTRRSTCARCIASSPTTFCWATASKKRCGVFWRASWSRPGARSPSRAPGRRA